MSGAADGGRDGGDLPERRGDARRESGLDDPGADDRALPPSDVPDDALRVQSLDIPAVAAQLSLSPRGLLSRLLRGSDGEGEGNVVTVDVPVVRDEDPPGGGTPKPNHDARSSLSSSFLSRRARRAEATDAANAAASRALFAATATEPPTRLASVTLPVHPTTEDERLESLAPLLERGAGARDGSLTRASPPYARTETDSADGFRGYLVGVPLGSAPVRNASAETRETLETGVTDEARLARAVADATDGEVGENAAAAAAAAAAARICGDASETRLAAADDDDVLVRRVIFAVPSRTSFGEGTVFDSGTASGAGGSPETLPSDSQRRPLKFGGASTRFSLPTAVTNVTLEMRSGDERDASSNVDDASSNGASSERSFFVANEGFLSESERKPPAAYAMRRLRASVVVERRVPVIGWLVLAAAVVSLSAMGTMVTLERSKPFTQSSWRAQSVLLIAAPWAAAKLKKQGWRGFRAPPTRRRALLVALCWSGWFLTLFYGLATTSIAHAYVLTNTTSAVIVVHTFLTGNAVPRSHVAGVALAMAGAGVVVWQSSFQSSGDARKNEDASSDASSGAATVAGDAVVAAGALSGAAFLVLAKKTREEVELSLLLVLQMLVNLPISLALALSLEGCSFVTPLDAKRGVFGWLAPSQIGKQLVISVCGTIVGTCGYLASLKYLAPTVVAIVMLCEPILATLIGWAAGFNAFPDWKTCSGMALVALGTAVIAVDAGRARARAVDVDAHRNAANAETRVSSERRDARFE